MRFALSLALLTALSGCDALPRDAEDTSRRIEHSHRYRIGVATAQTARAAALVARLDAKTGAHPALVRGASEPLLVALEAGEIDLVLAEFAADTPWKTRVALAPALSTRTSAGETLETRAAMRNGENRWIMTVEQVSRAVAGEPMS